MKPLFSFYGGKWRTARLYPEPEHKVVVEPFAGAAGYAVRHPDRDVILCDIDPIIAGLWSYLITASSAEILSIPDIRDGETVDDLRVCQEAKWLVGFWVNKGAASPRRRPSAWMRSGLRPGSFWGEAIRRRIAANVERIRHWRVFNCSYAECPAMGPATWFVDPPYQVAGKHYRFGRECVDFKSLAAWCRGREGQVIVCENAGADWLPFRHLAHTKTSPHPARRGRRSAEVVWP